MGGATFILALLSNFSGKNKYRLLTVGTLCFSIGLMAQLWFNHLRYGSIVEFGYSGVIQLSSMLNYFQRFDYPYRHEPFLSAGNELLSTLFFDHSWKSDTLRWRMNTFTLYNPSHLLCLGASLAALILMIFKKVRSRSFGINFDNGIFKLIYFSLWWGWLTFIILFAFYLRSPALSSRYLADFLPAISAAVIALCFLCIWYLVSIKDLKLTGVFVVLAIISFAINDLSSCVSFFQPLDQPSSERVVSKEEIIKLTTLFYKRTSKHVEIPNAIYCHRHYNANDISKRIVGWQQQTSCVVLASTSVILPTRSCININYSFNINKQPEVLVKRDTSLLKLAKVQISRNPDPGSEDMEISQKFCSETPLDRKYSFYTIRWIPVEHYTKDELPIKLNWVSLSDN